jgi:hypothetical protein
MVIPMRFDEAAFNKALEGMNQAEQEAVHLLLDGIDEAIEQMSDAVDKDDASFHRVRDLAFSVYMGKFTRED